MQLRRILPLLLLAHCASPSPSPHSDLVSDSDVGDSDVSDSDVTDTDVTNLPPTIAIATPSANATMRRGATAVSGTVRDSDGTVASVTLSLDGAAAVAAVISAGTFAATLDTAAAAPGEHTVVATATDDDAATATTQVTFTLTSAAAPLAILTGAPTGTVDTRDATVTVSGTDLVAYKYALDAGSFGAETPLATPITLTSLGEGAHTLSVVGKNDEGLWQADADATTATWTIDLSADTQLSGDPPALSNATALDVTVSGTHVVTYDYELLRDGGAYDAGTGVDVATKITSALGEGAYTLTVTGTNEVGRGDATPEVRTFTIDQTPPVAALSGLPGAGPDPLHPASSTSATIDILPDDGLVAYQYDLDSGQRQGPFSESSDIVLTSLAAGAHVLNVYGIDAATNENATPTSWTWLVVGSGAPGISSVPPSFAPLAADAPVTIHFSTVVSTSSITITGALSADTPVVATFPAGQSYATSVTLTPAPTWTAGEERTLTVSATTLDTTSNASSDFVFDVYSGARNAIYVRAAGGDGLGGSDTTDCTSPNAPCASLDYALAQAVPPANLFMADGTYAGAELTGDVSIYGGYARADWNARGTGSGTLVSSASASTAAESVIACAVGLGRGTIIDGLALANATPAAALPNVATVYLAGGCSPTLRRLDITISNSVQLNAGILTSASAAHVSDCQIHGPAITANEAAAVRIEDDAAGTFLLDGSTISYADGSNQRAKAVDVGATSRVDIIDNVISLGSASFGADFDAIVGPASAGHGDTHALGNTITIGPRDCLSRGPEVSAMRQLTEVRDNIVTFQGLTGFCDGRGIGDSDACVSNQVFLGASDFFSYGLRNCAQVTGTTLAPSRVVSGSGSYQVGISVPDGATAVVDHARLESGGSPFNPGVLVGAGATATLDSIEIFGARDGVDATDSALVWLTGSHIEATNLALSLSGITDMKIANNGQPGSPAIIGADITVTAPASFTRAEITDNVLSAAAVSLLGSSDQVATVAGNTISSNGSCVRASVPVNVVRNQLTCGGNGLDSFYAGATTSQFDSNTTAAFYGVLAEGSGPVAVYSNSFFMTTDVGASPVGVNSSGQPVTLVNNLFIGLQANAIGVQAPAAAVSADTNAFAGDGTWAVLDSTSYSTKVALEGAGFVNVVPVSEAPVDLVAAPGTDAHLLPTVDCSVRAGGTISGVMSTLDLDGNTRTANAPSSCNAGAGGYSIGAYENDD